MRKKTAVQQLDMTPRYAPTHVIIAQRMKLFPPNARLIRRNVAVTGARVYPVGHHPIQCPIAPEYCALELRTVAGSRWYGCERAYINSELRMVVIGTPARDEVRMKWEIVPEDRQA
jgi:hypothetical protein